MSMVMMKEGKTSQLWYGIEKTKLLKNGGGAVVVAEVKEEVSWRLKEVRQQEPWQEELTFEDWTLDLQHRAPDRWYGMAGTISIPAHLMVKGEGRIKKRREDSAGHVVAG
ncbi:hypothetical protein VTL71DRAFT_833 [Oculimacula yallundae]|uniref:Uncharacterized protein n=1 Tax=Oculimacula yallundae TaxID=86028 RepID=A0ABR4D1D8_9HELO